MVFLILALIFAIVAMIMMIIDDNDTGYSTTNVIFWILTILYLVIFFKSSYTADSIMRDYESGLIKKEYKIIDSDTTYTWKYYNK